MFNSVQLDPYVEDPKNVVEVDFYLGSDETMSKAIKENDTVFVERISRNISRFLGKLEIIDEKTFNAGTFLWKWLKDWKRLSETERKQEGKPYRDKVNSINDKYEKLSAPLEKFEKMIKSQIEEYQSILEMRRIVNLKSAQEASEILGESVLLPEQPKSLRGNGAIAYQKIERKFRVLDLVKIPLKYLMINEAKIKEDIKLGIFEIPGIEIYEEKTTQLRSR
jgi:hypothetical protein